MAMRQEDARRKSPIQHFSSRRSSAHRFSPLGERLEASPHGSTTPWHLPRRGLPTREPPDVQHAQNCNPFPRGATTAMWSDNGRVILEHSTEIESGAAQTAVTFYSLCMHLSEIGRIVPAGRTARRSCNVVTTFGAKTRSARPVGSMASEARSTSRSAATKSICSS